MAKYSGSNRRNGEPGRRITDSHCPFYPDNCRDILATKKEMKDVITDLRNKLPSWIFRLFVSTFIPISFLILGWIGYQTLKGNEIMVRLDTNQRVILKAFDLEPKK